MAKPNKLCFNCGKPYRICYVCDTTLRFSFREVCCTPECYAEYLQKINGDFEKIKEDLASQSENDIDEYDDIEDTSEDN